MSSRPDLAGPDKFRLLSKTFSQNKQKLYHNFIEVFYYSSFPLSMGDTFQGHHWIPITMNGINSYIYVFFLHTYLLQNLTYDLNTDKH
jgi:hypothetical protein